MSHETTQYTDALKLKNVEPLLVDDPNRLDPLIEFRSDAITPTVIFFSPNSMKVECESTKLVGVRIGSEQVYVIHGEASNNAYGIIYPINSGRFQASDHKNLYDSLDLLRNRCAIRVQGQSTTPILDADIMRAVGFRTAADAEIPTNYLLLDQSTSQHGSQGAAALIQEQESLCPMGTQASPSATAAIEQTFSAMHSSPWDVFHTMLKLKDEEIVDFANAHGKFISTPEKFRRFEYDTVLTNPATSNFIGSSWSKSSSSSLSPTSIPSFPTEVNADSREFLDRMSFHYRLSQLLTQNDKFLHKYKGGKVSKPKYKNWSDDRYLNYKKEKVFKTQIQVDHSTHFPIPEQKKCLFKDIIPVVLKDPVNHSVISEYSTVRPSTSRPPHKFHRCKPKVLEQFGILTCLAEIEMDEAMNLKIAQETLTFFKEWPITKEFDFACLMNDVLQFYPDMDLLNTFLVDLLPKPDPNFCIDEENVKSDQVFKFILYEALRKKEEDVDDEEGKVVTEAEKESGKEEKEKDPEKGDKDGENATNKEPLKKLGNEERNEQEGRESKEKGRKESKEEGPVILAYEYQSFSEIFSSAPLDKEEDKRKLKEEVLKLLTFFPPFLDHFSKYMESVASQFQLTISWKDEKEPPIDNMEEYELFCKKIAAIHNCSESIVKSLIGSCYDWIKNLNDEPVTLDTFEHTLCFYLTHLINLGIADFTLVNPVDETAISKVINDLKTSLDNKTIKGTGTTATGGAATTTSFPVSTVATKFRGQFFVDFKPYFQEIITCRLSKLWIRAFMLRRARRAQFIYAMDGLRNVKNFLMTKSYSKGLGTTLRFILAVRQGTTMAIRMLNSDLSPIHGIEANGSWDISNPENNLKVKDEIVSLVYKVQGKEKTQHQYKLGMSVDDSDESVRMHVIMDYVATELKVEKIDHVISFPSEIVRAISTSRYCKIQEQQDRLLWGLAQCFVNPVVSFCNILLENGQPFEFYSKFDALLDQNIYRSLLHAFGKSAVCYERISLAKLCTYPPYRAQMKLLCDLTEDGYNLVEIMIMSLKELSEPAKNYFINLSLSRKLRSMGFPSTTICKVCPLFINDYGMMIDNVKNLPYTCGAFDDPTRSKIRQVMLSNPTIYSQRPENCQDFSKEETEWLNQELLKLATLSENDRRVKILFRVDRFIFRKIQYSLTCNSFIFYDDFVVPFNNKKTEKICISTGDLFHYQVQTFKVSHTLDYRFLKEMEHLHQIEDPVFAAAVNNPINTVDDMIKINAFAVLLMHYSFFFEIIDKKKSENEQGLKMLCTKERNTVIEKVPAGCEGGWDYFLGTIFSVWPRTPFRDTDLRTDRMGIRISGERIPVSYLTVNDKKSNAFIRFKRMKVFKLITKGDINDTCRLLQRYFDEVFVDKGEKIYNPANYSLERDTLMYPVIARGLAAGFYPSHWESNSKNMCIDVYLNEDPSLSSNKIAPEDPPSNTSRKQSGSSTPVTPRYYYSSTSSMVSQGSSRGSGSQLSLKKSSHRHHHHHQWQGQSRSGSISSSKHGKRSGASGSVTSIGARTSVSPSLSSTSHPREPEQQQAQSDQQQKQSQQNKRRYE